VKEVTKAVIPAAGLGTRFLPVTKAMPKEMLPLIDHPTIHYVVKEAVDSGIEDIIIITGRNKRPIEDYFDDSPELELHLQKQGKTTELDMIQNISDLADIHYIRQKEPRGLGDAVFRASKHINGEPFAVLLGDDIVVHEIPCTKQLLNHYERNHCSVIAVEEVPFEMVNRYGILKGKCLDEIQIIMEDIVEKPEPEQAPSRMGAIGRYLFNPEIMDCIKETKTGVGGEIQLTDAIRLLRTKQNVYGYCFRGKRYDTGDRLGYIQATIDLSLQDPELAGPLLKYLNEKYIQENQ
jgi:UTP--glucose-1-phosphate uridylyltransferase